MSTMQSIRLSPVPVAERENYLDLLFIGDESLEAIHQYLHKGELYLISEGQKTIGAIHVLPSHQKKAEIMNMAIYPKYQRKGLGKAALNEACSIYFKKGYETIVLGTANSSLGNLAFYQKAGFRITSVKKDFFADYPNPIYENGIRALDMIMLERH